MPETNTPGLPRYSQRLRAEIEHFRRVENVHDLPEIFHVWSAKYVRPKAEEVLGLTIAGMEDFYAKYIGQCAAENPSRTFQILSIGAGNGDLEVRIAKQLKSSGLDRFQFQCMDINPAMLDRGREAASKEQLSEYFEFLQLDVADWSSTHPVGVVMAHHSLHHIQQLENTFANIKRAIGRDGYFLTCDMIGRNGHMRWPEALDTINDIWRTIPRHYKYNHQTQRFEEQFENVDCSSEGFEGIRAQEILPLLLQDFEFEQFVAFGNLPDIFVDRSFGHNLNPKNQEDVEFIYRIGDLNDRLISDGAIKPTQMMAVMRGRRTRPCKYYLHWSPEFCVRVPPPSQQPPIPIPDIETVQVMVTGPGVQNGVAHGIWADGWIAPLFDAWIRCDKPLDGIVVEGYLPEDRTDPPELRIYLDGVELKRQRVGSGAFSLRLKCAISQTARVQLRIVSNTSFCPAAAGNSNDARELAIVLRGVHLIPSKNQLGHRSWLHKLLR